MFEKPPFNKDEEARIVSAVKEAELKTSGEIRIHVEKHSKLDPMKRAVEMFEKLGITKTEQRNGVLIYIATVDHKFAIIGDKGINEAVPADFWETTKELMAMQFKAGNLTEGIIAGIKNAGIQLKAFFPYEKGDVNELSDNISYGNDGK
jgi:uncharacterized membrane protein